MKYHSYLQGHYTLGEVLFNRNMNFCSYIIEISIATDQSPLKYTRMKKASDCYYQLTDTFFYLSSSWLHLDLAEGTKREAYNILGAASYLFDNLFAKEDAGEEITRDVYADLLSKYDPKALSSKATAIRLNMSKETFENPGSPFREYYQWILPSEPELQEAMKDNAGLLAFSTIDALVSLVAEQNKEAEPLRIAEIIFLNITKTFERIFRAHYGEDFRFLASSPYFLSVEEEFERIRASIED